MKALHGQGYRAGALVIDAALFLPQSRPRLFIVGVREGHYIPESLISDSPEYPFHTAAVRAAFESMPSTEQDAWAWWRLPAPKRRNLSFADLLEDDASWHSQAKTQELLNMMSQLHLAKVATARKLGKTIVGAVYKRTREGMDGVKVQRAEVRFDDTAGCLRTPGGGSSRQSILVVQGSQVRSRLLTPREAARLMGLPDQYKLPPNYNDAYRLVGDGVAVPVVNHLRKHLLEPLLESSALRSVHAA
jgi:DNA (cytosine-5)-methyltransferase 1